MRYEQRTSNERIVCIRARGFGPAAPVDVYREWIIYTRSNSLETLL